MKKYRVLIAAVLAVALAIPVFATSVMTIDVEPDVKVYVNDAPIDAGETHGNPEAFIYNGTTYIAAKAVSLSLGENVKWDGGTRSVYIGKHPEDSSYLLNVCPPYQEEWLETLSTVNMAGEKYANCISFKNHYSDGYALFNLNGKYNELTFTLGHIDGRRMDDEGQCNIYLDGELALSIDLDPEMMPREYTVPLNGALQMKIAMNDWGGHTFALADVRVS